MFQVHLFRQEQEADAEKTRTTRLEVSQGHQTQYHRHVRYGFHCSIVTLSLKLSGRKYLTLKNVVTLKSGSEVKYVDDTTITETGHSSSTSRMHEYLDNLLLWTQENDMKINISKTKELLMGPWGRCDIAPLQTISGIIERVSEVKLLGVYIDSSLSWNKH